MRGPPLSQCRRSLRLCARPLVLVIASTLLMTIGANPATASPGRAYVSNNGSDTVTVVDTATNTVIAVIPVGDRPRGLAVTADGARVFVANEGDNNVSVISTASNTVVATVPVGRAPRSVAIAPAGWGAWVSTLGGLWVIDTATYAIRARSPEFPLNDVAFSPGGNPAYAVTVDDTLAVLDIAHLSVSDEVPTGHTPHDVEVSADGRRIYVVDSTGGLRAYEPVNSTRVAEVARAQFPEVIRDAVLNADGTRLYITQDFPQSVLVLDAATLAVVATVPLEFLPMGLGLSPAGDRLYVTGGQTAEVDTATNVVVGTIPVAGFQVAVTSSTPPPPPAPVIEGATFYTDGTSTRSGATPGTRISLFTSSAVPGVSYRLVLSRDGCRTVLAVLNATARYASTSGVIGSTAGYVPAGTPAGRYQICFLAPAGGGSTITGPVTLDVNPS